jgi:hypothetical protein
MFRLNLLLLASCLLIVLGCKSAPQTGSAWLASVVISNKTPSQIRVTAIDVFETNGFRIKTMKTSEIVLDRPGTKMENVLYGGLSTGIWTRAKLRSRNHGPDAFLLECNAYFVENHDDTALETERKLHRSGPFQKLLDEVQKRLQ